MAPLTKSLGNPFKIDDVVRLVGKKTPICTVKQILGEKMVYIEMPDVPELILVRIDRIELA